MYFFEKIFVDFVVFVFAFVHFIKNNQGPKIPIHAWDEWLHH